MTVTITAPWYGKTVQITQFADDQPPFEVDPIEVTGSGVGLNGDLVTHTKPVASPVKLSVIPNTSDDADLAAMLQMSRAGSPVAAIAIIPTLKVEYPLKGVALTYKMGKMQGGPNGDNVSNEGKIQGKQYSFVFEKMERSDMGLFNAITTVANIASLLS